HLYDRRAKAAVPLPGVDEGGSANLTVSNTGLIGSDHNSNGPAQVYDSKAKAFRDVGFDPVNGHRQTWLSGDGHWLATTCADHCVTDPGGEPDLFVQNLVTKTNYEMPNDMLPDQNAEHPCVDGDGSLVGVNLTNPAQHDIFLYSRVSKGLLPLPNDAVRDDAKCAIDPAGQHVVLQDEATGTDRLYDRVTGALVPMPGKVQGQLYLSDPFDLTPPQTTIVRGPKGIVGSRRALLAYASSEPGSTFQCSLDGAPFKACASPRTYTGLKDGTHTFRVRARDAAGNVDPTPATRSWKIGLAVTRLAIKPKSFKSKKGARVTFVLTRAGKVRFTVCRKKNGKCVRVKGAFKRTGKAGKNTFRFRGRVAGHTLAPGRYVLIARPGGKRAGFRLRRP
ncbi:MAG: large repetitive protein, partial [Thermoleophilaceae bacterium]|nr:large repetitive protein [Thermoleophilaceae bacterium]